MADRVRGLPPLLRVYRTLIASAEGPLRMYLRRRTKRGKEDPSRLTERFGHAGAARPEGALVWAHAASVGESLAILPLLEDLLAERAGLSALITTGTVTSARLLADRLGPRMQHQFVPLDHPGAVGRFLDHWRPDLALWVESEFWPNLITQTRARGVPMVLVNARFSERSANGWARARASIGRILGCFDLALAVNEPTAGRLRSLGAQNVQAVGNLKWASPPLPAAADTLAELRAALGSRSRWLAASTHEGEEAIAGTVHKALAARYPDLVTLIAPRHPERGPVIADALADMGLEAGLRSRGDRLGEVPLYIADTIGEMGLFYRLVDVGFVGGSLVTHGGQNPLEGARLGLALLHGRHTENFAELYEALDRRGGALLVDGPEVLGAEISDLLAKPERRDALRREAEAFAAEGAALRGRVADYLTPYIDEAMGPAVSGGGR